VSNLSASPSTETFCFVKGWPSREIGVENCGDCRLLMREPPSMRILWCLFFGLTMNGLLAQSSEGTDFWFTFLQHRDAMQARMVAMVSAREATTGTLSIPGIGFSEEFAVGANSVALISLPPGAESIGSEVITRNAVHLVSSGTVSLYIHQYFGLRSEASIVLPSAALGRDYYLMTYVGYQDGDRVFPSEFAVVAREDDTTIEIINARADTEMGHREGTNWTVTLDRGEVYQVRALKAEGDFTGTRIRGDKPFALFGGNAWTQVPSTCGYRDNLLEQMYPMESWGSEVAAVPSAQVNGNLYRILAGTDGTVIKLDGRLPRNYWLDAGEFAEFEYSDGFIASSNHPILVAQFNKGTQCSAHDLGDPSMVLLNGVRQTLDTITVYNSGFEAITENYINVVLQAGDELNTQIDGQDLPGPFTPLGTDGKFVYTQLRVGVGSHTITSSGCGTIVTAYGYGFAESYAYGGGAAFRPINTNPIVEGGCLNDTIFFDTGLDTNRFELQWTFHDGMVSAHSQVARIYDTLGSYPVELIVHDRCFDRRDTSTQDLQITLRQAISTTPDLSLCPGEVASFSATDLPGARYTWSGPHGFLAETQSIAISNVSSTNSGTYAAVGSVSGCATFPAEVSLRVHPVPEVFFDNDTAFCPRIDDWLTLVPEPAFSDYQWSDGSTGSQLDVVEGGTYALTVTDANGCETDKVVSVSAFCPTAVYVPTAFSPNGDGINDQFEVFAYDATYVQLRIFDRWGKLVFAAEGDQLSWDGMNDGEAFPPGYYAYTLEIHGDRGNGIPFQEVRSGQLLLVK
jgi:gliding motility-associated-like protein